MIIKAVSLDNRQLLIAQKFATKEIIHLILQSAVFGLVEVGLVLLTYNITQKISHRGSYLYSLMILFSVIILRKLLDI
jgi:hypothetical protein